jgi:hypothetical protein
MELAAAAALLEDLADRALRSEFEPVVCWKRPEAVGVPIVRFWVQAYGGREPPLMSGLNVDLCQLFARCASGNQGDAL